MGSLVNALRNIFLLVFAIHVALATMNYIGLWGPAPLIQKDLTPNDLYYWKEYNATYNPNTGQLEIRPTDVIQGSRDIFEYISITAVTLESIGAPKPFAWAVQMLAWIGAGWVVVAFLRGWEM